MIALWKLMLFALIEAGIGLWLGYRLWGSPLRKLLKSTETKTRVTVKKEEPKKKSIKELEADLRTADKEYEEAMRELDQMYPSKTKTGG